MNRKQLEEMFKESCKIIMQYSEGSSSTHINNFIFDIVIPEVLKSVMEIKPHYCAMNDGQECPCKIDVLNKIKQRAKKLYNIIL